MEISLSRNILKYLTYFLGHLFFLALCNFVNLMINISKYQQNLNYLLNNNTWKVTHFHEKSKINQNQLIYLVVFYLLIHFDFSFNSMIFWSFFKIKLFILFKSSLYWEIIFFYLILFVILNFFSFDNFEIISFFSAQLSLFLNQKIYR